MKPQQPTIADICLSPAEHFGSPSELLNSGCLDRVQKARALRCWEVDERLKMVATQENMTGGAANLLQQVLLCLGEVETTGGVD